jgi:hypothetical protein
MAKNLNKDTVYRAAKPKDKDYTINDGECLALLVKTNGSKLWRFIYRFGGKQNRLGFGSYPETSLESARRKAEAAREQIANGIDPSATRKQEKADHQQAVEAQIRLDAGLPLIRRHYPRMVGVNCPHRPRHYPTKETSPVRAVCISGNWPQAYRRSEVAGCFRHRAAANH